MFYYTLALMVFSFKVFSLAFSIALIMIYKVIIIVDQWNSDTMVQFHIINTLLYTKKISIY